MGWCHTERTNLTWLWEDLPREGIPRPTPQGWGDIWTFKMKFRLKYLISSQWLKSFLHRESEPELGPQHNHSPTLMCTQVTWDLVHTGSDPVGPGGAESLCFRPARRWGWRYWCGDHTWSGQAPAQKGPWPTDVLCLAHVAFQKLSISWQRVKNRRFYIKSRISSFLGEIYIRQSGCKFPHGAVGCRSLHIGLHWLPLHTFLPRGYPAACKC